MSRRTLTAIYASGLILALVVLLPMSFALKAMGVARQGLNAQEARGSLWRGALTNASLAGVSVGDVRLGLSPLGILKGGGRVWFEARGPVTARGVVRLSRKHFAIHDADASLPTRLLAPDSALQGRLRLAGFTAEFRDGDCRRASGTVQMESLGLSWADGLVLKGKAGCQGRLLVVPLSGQQDGVRIDAVVQVDGRGRYELRSLIRTGNANFLATGSTRGLERTLEGFRLFNRGRLGAHAGP